MLRKIRDVTAKMLNEKGGRIVGKGTCGGRVLEQRIVSLLLRRASSTRTERRWFGFGQNDMLYTLKLVKIHTLSHHKISRDLEKEKGL